MATFGDRPTLPEDLSELLSDETASTVFLKADCPPRVKSGHISEIRLVELEPVSYTHLTLPTTPYV